MVDIQRLQAQVRVLLPEQREFTDGPERAFANFKLAPIELLVEADWNYKQDDEEKQLKLKEKIARYGQVENIHVRHLPSGFLEVINGNHRSPLFRELGMKFALIYDWGDISLSLAKRIAIETNDDQFEPDEVKLAGLFRDLELEFGMEDLSLTMPYTVDEMEDHIGMLDYDLDALRNSGGLGGAKHPKPSGEGGQSLTLTLPNELYGCWLEWVNHAKSHGAESDVQAFEMALTEARKTLPEEPIVEGRTQITLNEDIHVDGEEELSTMREASNTSNEQ